MRHVYHRYIAPVRKMSAWSRAPRSLTTTSTAQTGKLCCTGLRRENVGILVPANITHKKFLDTEILDSSSYGKLLYL